MLQPAIKEVLLRAGAWARARERCRRLDDSKRASAAELNKARKSLAEASEALAVAVSKLERLLQGRRGARKVDWTKVFSAVGTFAAAVEASLRGARGKKGVMDVIDTTGEEV